MILGTYLFLEDFGVEQFPIPHPCLLYEALPSNIKYFMLDISASDEMRIRMLKPCGSAMPR